jgi:hypothetical protein
MNDRHHSRLRAAAMALLVAAAAALYPPAVHGQADGASVIARDGIAAIVNDEVISLGEVQRTALLRRDAATAGLGSTCGQGPAPGLRDAPADAALAPAGSRDSADAPSQEELTAALDCLIDATLVYREVRRFPQLGVTDAQVDDLMAQLQAAWESAEQLDAALLRLGLLRSEVRTDLRRQLLTAAYIDSRFRATVDISEEEAQRVWRDELVPDMRERGIEVPEFEEVAEDLVMPLLREREVNRRVQSWIGDLRTRATIDRRFP